MANIFISYSRDDEDKTKSLVDDMQKLRHTVWFDQELSGGEVWWDKILERIRNCDVFVFVLSVKSQNSIACKRELSYASELGKTILPLLIDEGVSKNLLPFILSKLQLVNYWKQDSSATIQLVNALATAQTNQPLPDPLPLPPEVPLSYYGNLAQQIDSTSDLGREEQSTLLLELKRGLNDPESSTDAWILIKKLRKRRDLFSIISDEIDNLSTNTLQATMSVVHQEKKSEQEESKKEQMKSTISKKTNKSTVDDVNNKGNALYMIERYEEAIIEYDKAIAIDPNDAFVFYNKGLTLYMLERYDEAITEYDKAIAIDPTNAETFNSKADVLFSLERYEEAIIEYDKAIAIDPTHSKIFNGKGNALYMLEGYDEAIAEFDKAIALDPNDAFVFNNKGIALYVLGRYDEAIAEFDKAIAIDPTNAETFNSKADVLFGLERYEEAIIEYDKAIAIDPNNALVFYNKGLTLYMLEQYDEAITEYDKAIAIDPSYAEAFKSKGLVLYMLERYDEAIIEYDKAIAIDPDDAISLYHKACLYALENNKNKFLQNLKEAIRKDNEYRELAKTDKVLEAYWNDKDFKKLVD